MINKLKKFDWGILLLLGLFMIISFFVVRSATYGDPRYASYDTKTLIFYGLGFIVVLFVSMIDYRVFLKVWHVLYGIGIVMLVAVLLFVPEINGAKGWFKLPGDLLFQPAEAVKLFLIIGIAVLMGRRKGAPLTFAQDLVPIGVFVGIPFVLVMAQPDLGNAVIYLVIALGMLWIGNVKYMHVLTGTAIVVAGLVAFVMLFNTFNAEIKQYLGDKKKLHWYQRINTFVNPSEATSDERHQAENAKIAIGSGGLTGDGFMQGDMKNRGFIPYPYSDSIFVVVGEEFGFQGAAILLLLYFLLIYRMIITAFQCHDLRASFIVIGIVSMFVFQIFQNIGMTIGLMPITGITLPFVSYGGTSLLINMFCIGLVFSIRAHQEVYQLND